MTITLPVWLCVVGAIAAATAPIFLYLIWCDAAAARKAIQQYIAADETKPRLPNGTRLTVQGVPGALYVSTQR